MLHPPLWQPTLTIDVSVSTNPANDTDTDMNMGMDRWQTAHSIFIHRGDTPETLRKHIDEITMAIGELAAPSAARLAQNSTRARGMDEPQGKEMLARDLLFMTEIDGGDELV